MSAASPRTLAFSAIGIAALALGAGAAFLLLRDGGSPPPAIGGYLLPKARELPLVALVDDGGAEFEASNFAGHWSFLYFGYTYCPDVCPLSLVELAAAKKMLALELPDEAVEYYLVSVDPARDTPARLREYVTYFDPDFHGLTGSPAALEELASATGSVFFVPDDQSDDNYLVSHSSNLVLLDPDGRLAAVLTPPHGPQQVAADFAVAVGYRRDKR